MAPTSFTATTQGEVLNVFGPFSVARGLFRVSHSSEDYVDMKSFTLIQDVCLCANTAPAVRLRDHQICVRTYDDGVYLMAGINGDVPVLSLLAVRVRQHADMDNPVRRWAVVLGVDTASAAAALWSLADRSTLATAVPTVYDMSHARKFNDEFAYMRDIDPDTKDGELFKFRALAKSLDVAVRRVDQLEAEKREASKPPEVVLETPPEAERGFWTGKLQNLVSLHQRTSELPQGSRVIEGAEQPASFFVQALREVGEIAEAMRFDRFASARTSHGAPVYKPLIPTIIGELRRVR